MGKVEGWLTALCRDALPAPRSRLTTLGLPPYRRRMTWIRRAWPIAVLALALGTACTDDTDPSGAESGGNDSAPGTADETSNDDSSAVCPGNAPPETTDGVSNTPLMETWGAACTTDAECVALIGEGAVCDTMAVVYELPQGYCTKPCSLPDIDTQFVLDAPDCDPGGGVACIGLMGMFERCGLVCADDMQCTRDGYVCRQMPLIAKPEDPRMCLMPDCCLDSCSTDA